MNIIKNSHLGTGVYVLENTLPLLGGGNISRCHLGKKYEKMKRKGGNVNEKEGNVKEKGRNEERGSKRVK
jgi:hypothetical protein